MIASRWEKVRSRLVDLKLDGFIFFDLHNIRYLTGFTGSDGAVVISSEDILLLTDSRYTVQAGEQFDPSRVFEYRIKSEGISQALKSLKINSVGFESDIVSYSLWQKLTEGNKDVRFQPVNAEIEDLRAVKEGAEVELIRKAARIAYDALQEMIRRVETDSELSELSMAWIFEKAMRDAGAEDKAFDLIIASGARSALPHGVSSDKIPQRGDMIVIDFGARYKGYNSDQTVTVCWGKADKEQLKIYNIVLEAQQRALKIIKPGVLFADIDAAARSYIESEGYGKYFGHGLGHGVGLDIHEAPRVSPLGEGYAQAGMVFTVEPGIYIPNWGGVRIEDMVICTEGGCQLLTTPNHGLLEVGS
jgi:Xaa-Pro aminopeptidase